MPEDRARMVHFVEIGSGASREEEAVRMTREGFMLLAMGFAGKGALCLEVGLHRPGQSCGDRAARDHLQLSPNFQK